MSLADRLAQVTREKSAAPADAVGVKVADESLAEGPKRAASTADTKVLRDAVHAQLLE